MKTFAVAIMVMAALPARAEDGGLKEAIQEKLEMPGHRALQSLIEDPDTTLAPFETDGCSGGMSWSWRTVAEVFPEFEQAQGQQPPWEYCCKIHDQAYHDAAGARDPASSFAARLEADLALQACVVAQGEGEVEQLAERYDVSEEQVEFAYELIAQSMFNAVRFGGGPCSGLPWRWGYGYPACVPGF